MERLKDKVAIITGGAAGIGKSTAALFLKEGASVMLVDINKEKLESTSKELDSQHLAYCVADVSNPADVERYTVETLSKFGKINLFFNNAGIEGASSSIEDYPNEVFDKVIAVNLKGIWYGCKYVIPKMVEGGSVIITSSVAGLKGFKGLGAYVTSKHAVIGIMRVSALEFADRKIRVNTIHPGPVNTQMMRRIETDISPDNSAEVQKGFEAIVPYGRYAEALEISNLVLYLASDESKYVNGSTYVIDGGLMAG
jgi:NAD(P)-dependent dehydrogenase (short-subunit alcohol dehydrogenase family)